MNMLNNKTSSRPYKDAVYGRFAETTRALGGARRLELVDLLVQGPRTVDALARATEQPIASASQHLQVLRRAHLVETRRLGRQIEYRLAPGVADVLVALRRLAQARDPALAEAQRRYYADRDAPETIDAAALRRRMADGSVVLVDVRPAAEYRAAHIAGARSIPLAELDGALHTLPTDTLIVATCRGPYCVYAADAVRTLRAAGHEAVRFEDGVAEWAADGGPLATGDTP
jgi:rhodanese-related sulfurtransferase